VWSNGCWWVKFINVVMKWREWSVDMLIGPRGEA